MSRPGPISTRTPIVLLGLMTAFSFGGPFVIFATIQGGASPDWPPDRPIEWWTFGLITALVVVLLFACLSLGLARRQVVSSEKGDSRGERGGPMTDAK